MRYFIVFLIISVNCTHNPEGSAVTFPEVSDPVQITQHGKEYLFASYYGINSFSKSQKFATVLETDVKYRLPTDYGNKNNMETIFINTLVVN